MNATTVQTSEGFKPRVVTLLSKLWYLVVGVSRSEHAQGHTLYLGES